MIIIKTKRLNRKNRNDFLSFLTIIITIDKIKKEMITKKLRFKYLNIV